MRSGRICVAIGFLAAGVSSSAGEPILELKVGDTSYVGCAVAHNDDVCWLAHADGQLSELAVPTVTSFRRVGDEFRGLTLLEARNQLRAELGRGWEVVGTGHYLVCTKSDSGRNHAQHFEDLYRSFRSYFTRRGFDLPEPKFPLIAIVFSNHADFVEQCREDEISSVSGLRGYYLRTTNRICLYEDGERAALPMTPGDLDDPFGTDRVRASSLLSVPATVDLSTSASLKDTIVHEATHQLAFNLGLHSRIGQPPKWVVEGLATMFEAEGTRANTASKLPRDRINEERFWWFNTYREQRREPGSLADFVSSDDAFCKSVLDFYSEAWALTFFLAETRPREYHQYLKMIADRDPLPEYDEGARLKDFQAAFGDDIDRLEVDLLRFFGDIQ